MVGPSVAELVLLRCKLQKEARRMLATIGTQGWRAIKRSWAVIKK
jgi:hypothetical protein